MIVLGTTSKDKGTQLETLVRVVLTDEGYDEVRTNVIGAGGNELDVTAVGRTQLLDQVSTTPVICEAKAYADTVDMPTWQRFLGKLFLGRNDNHRTIGVLIALNGVNGNVAGSVESLQRSDSGVLVIDGAVLVARAQRNAELTDEVDAAMTAEAVFARRPQQVEPAYYNGAWLWVVRWGTAEYSVLRGDGTAPVVEDLDELRPALAHVLPGALLAPGDAAAAAEAQHDRRLQLLGRLFAGEELTEADTADFYTELAEESFCEARDGRVHLRAADTLDGGAVGRLFRYMLQQRIRVRHLGFIARQLHTPYVERLVDVLPSLQHGLTLNAADGEALRRLIPLFPSVWANIIEPIPFLVPHERGLDGEDGAEVDRNAFWEVVQTCIRTDFADPVLRGFLFDYLGVAELEEQHHVVVKTKVETVAETRTTLRNGIGILDVPDDADIAAPHVLMRMLPSAAEPWEHPHPEPQVQLDER